MCGIVGLFLKDSSLEPQLGSLLADMLETMTGRGPDSAGFAVYGSGGAGRLKLTVRGQALDSVAADIGGDVRGEVRDTHLVLSIPATEEAHVREWLASHRPDLRIIGAGERIELYKEVGLPADVARRFGLEKMSGTHGIGHTRMATESAVTTDGAHPFSTGADQCLVHNGSLSNHRSLRRMLEPKGIAFATDNDSEVAAGYLSWKLQEGATLATALQDSLSDLDGFFTFVIGTESGFAVLRDPISCKPAVMAETDQYVAFGSEYRALVGLPGIEKARVFEPEPARVYVWERN
ncbi:class II glutamine amidotransferase [Rhizorhabdus dicambivorans]|uniref:Glutamine amidotransferase n=1 Tax=Rhizorhabdus dicambivorans TaxID=1850238 RepID=A0A2A4FXV6_9SPHN|nr:glutamine amidotransferase family protein [Rhizorhabdus dicambivorans]ATE63108.1 glutamine amidotransferase [Rhizorhabdus dicambivorans]PCE43284.1 glutamine amidotransferase [Rhizorhabdus dicambivorans]